MKDWTSENFTMNKDFPDDYYEKWTAFILAVKIILSQNENLWDKYQNRNSKKRTPFLIKQLSNCVTDCILENKTMLYRARAINYKNQLKCNTYKDIENYCIAVKKEIEKIGKIPLKINDAELFYVLLTSQCENADLELLKNEFLKIKEKEFKGFGKEECSGPPVNKIIEGRLNAKGDEFLYLALSKDTCIKEMRPAMHHTYSIATCVTLGELKLCDLTKAALLKASKKKKLANNSWLAVKLSEPNCVDDKKFYAITQELSTIIKSQGYDGIKYDSAMDDKGINIMLFDKNDVEFISSEIAKVNKISIDFTTF